MKHGKVVNELDRVETYVGWIIFICIVCTLCSGCGSQAGWRFSVGVSPVTAIHDEATLTDHTEAKDGK